MGFGPPMWSTTLPREVALPAPEDFDGFSEVLRGSDVSQLLEGAFMTGISLPLLAGSLSFGRDHAGNRGFADGNEGPKG